ncbi:MAG: hypothetical protein PHS86_11390, partial [Syntrophaceae bacterium]|nr:hypothetical protein [Syntrophaceae bacterium]
MNNIGGYQKTLRRIDIGFYLFIMILCGIVTDVCADSKKVAEPALSCKYFDSLSSDLNSCKSLNRGRKIEVKAEGKHTALHRAALELLASNEDGRKEVDDSGDKISFEAWIVDLNDDGIEEAILFTPANFRGASGNGDIIVFQRQQKKKVPWKAIGFLLGHHVHIERIKSNEFHGLVTNWNMGAKSGVLTRYKMDKRAG